MIKILKTFPQYRNMKDGLENQQQEDALKSYGTSLIEVSDDKGQ